MSNSPAAALAIALPASFACGSTGADSPSGSDTVDTDVDSNRGEMQRSAEVLPLVDHPAKEAPELPQQAEVTLPGGKSRVYAVRADGDVRVASAPGGMARKKWTVGWFGRAA